jgi:hypothetical protein
MGREATIFVPICEKTGKLLPDFILIYRKEKKWRGWPTSRTCRPRGDTRRLTSSGFQPSRSVELFIKIIFDHFVCVTTVSFSIMDPVPHGSALIGKGN